jgi:hypothetical protein
MSVQREVSFSSVAKKARSLQSTELPRGAPDPLGSCMLLAKALYKTGARGIPIVFLVGADGETRTRTAFATTPSR